MGRVFVYWDNSNVLHEAQRLADERECTPNARYLVRVHASRHGPGTSLRPHDAKRLST